MQRFSERECLKSQLASCHQKQARVIKLDVPNPSAGHGWALKDSVHESLRTSGNILPQQMVDILDAYKEAEKCNNALRYGNR